MFYILIFYSEVKCLFINVYLPTESYESFNKLNFSIQLPLALIILNYYKTQELEDLKFIWIKNSLLMNKFFFFTESPRSSQERLDSLNFEF